MIALNKSLLTTLFSVETSLETDDCEEKFDLRGYKQKSIKVGNGKGISTYYNPAIAQVITLIAGDKHQIIKFNHRSLNVINTYRSQNCRQIEFLESLKSVVEVSRSTIITGDFNLCFNENRSSKVIDYLLGIGFNQLVQEPTHIKGRLIDHAYWLDENEHFNIELERYSPYYTDHDGLCITISDKQK